MSHYTVAVIHRENQDIANLLAPYYENLKVEPYIWLTKNEAIDYVRKYYSSMMKDASPEECYEMIKKDHEADEDGNILSTYNPKSKWDWWVPGGRFCGLLVNKDGDEVDEGKLKDLVFEVDEEIYKNSKRWWEVAIEDAPLKDGEEDSDFFTFYKKEYYLGRYGDADTYAKYRASFSTYAVVTPDGEWHAPGEVGYFACSSETDEEARDWYDNYFDRFIAGADPDLVLTIVDCHI